MSQYYKTEEANAGAAYIIIVSHAPTIQQNYYDYLLDLFLFQRINEAKTDNPSVIYLNIGALICLHSCPVNGN